jgi:hypothetical protein
MSKNQPFNTFGTKKAQSRTDKNHSVPAVTGFRFRCRDKIEPNLQSQMYAERTPTWWSPASSGVSSLLEIGTASNLNLTEFLYNFLAGHNCFGFSGLSF